MGLLDRFKLQRLKIHTFEKITRKGGGFTLSKNSIEVQFNPESISRSFSNYFEKKMPLKKRKATARYTGGEFENISLKLIIDGTEVDQILREKLFMIGAGGSKGSVYDRVEEFIKATSTINGNIHEPNFLQLDWGGKVKFNCRLKTLQIKYSLFDRSGDPLRAELDCTFVGDTDPQKYLKDLALSSPDMTHFHMVRAGDDLLHLVEEIYGDAKYYLAVARANNLDDFRNLIPGTELVFPPLKD